MQTIIFRSLISLLCLMPLLGISAKAEDGKKNTAIRSAMRGPSGRDSVAADNKAKHSFQSGRKPGQIDNVKVQLKVAGDIIDTVADKANREKIALACNLEYDEKTLVIPPNVMDVSRSARYYNKTAVEIKAGDKVFKPALRPERLLIVNEITPKSALLFSPDGPLSSEELDLIDVQADSLLLDRFLPEQPVAIGDSWKHSERLMAEFLGLDEVGQCDVQSVLKEVTDQVARFELSGKVSGAIDGVTTEIELKAIYRFILRNNRIDWLGMALKENRKSSPVADGLDVSAQFQVMIVPAETSAHLNEADLKNIPSRSNPELLQLSYTSKQGGWELTHDRDWHVYRDHQDTAVLRRIDGGDLIAQCNLSSLSQAKPDKLVTLEEFQEDIKRGLSKEFKEFVEAGQSVDKLNRRVLRVVVRGTASELPIVWRYYHIADQDGRQMGGVFTIEEKYAERLANSDRELMESLRFGEAKK